jgi:hypothetical protein
LYLNKHSNHKKRSKSLIDNKILHSYSETKFNNQLNNLKKCVEKYKTGIKEP